MPDPAAFTLAVTLGYDRAADERTAALVRAEVDWLHAADRAGTAVLGVGSGAQTLAIALGGGVERARRARHGWVWVSSSDPGGSLPGRGSRGRRT